MNKFLKIFLICLAVLITLLVVIFISVRAFGDKILCAYADNLCEKKDYAYAYTIYEAITTYRPNNNEYKTKLAKCLVKMPFTYSVQKKLLETAQSDDNSEAEKITTKRIIYLRNKIAEKFGDTYIKEAVKDDVVLRWSRKSFPLKYYIEPFKAVPDYYFEESKKAFEAWERETDEFIKFQPVNNDAAADIILKFRPTATGKSEFSHGQYEVAITSPVIDSDNKLKQMNIVCSIKPHTGEYFTHEQIKTIITHEIGHALGIWGHPTDMQSVMYYSLDNPYDYYEKRIDTSIGNKDIATIKLLYALAANVTNNSEEVQNKEKFIYPKVLIAPLDNANDTLIAEAKQLLAEHPNDMSYALSLADTYNATGKYQESTKLMLFLTEQTDNRDLLNILYYNIANNYISLHDFTNAMLYAQKAKTYVNNADNRCLIAYIKYCSGKLDAAEQEFLAILAKNPAHTAAALGLADVYIKKKKYGQARQTLKELLKHNPDALEDKSLNSYKLLTIL